MRLKHIQHVLLSTLLLALLVFSLFTSVQAAEEDTESAAEVNAYIVGDIPSINISDWTPITIHVTDAFGIDWDRLKSTIPEWYMRLIWPFNPSFPQPVERFLGHTSIRFDPEIIEGDSNGWFMRVIPSTVIDSNSGDVHTIVLEAKTDDSAVDYTVVIGVKCTRIDTLGGEIGSSYIYIPVKASPTNYVEMRTSVTTKNAGLKQMVYFDVQITNNGYYRDVFELDLQEENGLMGLANEQIIVMDPGETKQVTIGVLTPEKVFDPGTPNKINVYVSSIGDPSKTFVGSLVIITQGMYISPIVGLIAAPIIILLLFIFFIYYMLRVRKQQKLFVKPEKPWTIPEERTYLTELKEKDPKKYEEVLQMMKQEYQSALLWYESYKQEITRKPVVQKKQQPSKNNETLNRFSNDKKEKTKQPQKKKEEQTQPIIPVEKQEEQPDIIKQQYKAIDKKQLLMQQKKQKAMDKIHKQQEKQNKKRK